MARLRREVRTLKEEREFPKKATAPVAADGDAPPPVAAAPVAASTGTSAERRPAILLPGEALGGLAVTAERVYVPDALGHGVWVVDPRRGRRVETVPAGKGPLAITLSPPP